MSESVQALFDNTVKKFSKRPAIQYFCKRNQKWIIKNWLELAANVAKIANGVLGLRVNADDRIAILSMTRPEWVMSDIAIMKASCIVVPIYHSSLTDQIAYILSDSDAQIIFLEDEAQLKKIREAENNGIRLKRIIIFDRVSVSLKENECYLEDFIAGRPEQFNSNWQKSDSIASLVYTSGTTGEPKGAMISHDNLLYEAHVIDKLGILTSDDVQLIFLPLAHIFARVLELAWLRTGHLLAFAQSIEKVVDDMAVVKPTLMAGVPRIFEKVRTKTMEAALSSRGIKKYLSRFAFKEADRLLSNHHSVGLGLMLAKKLVFKKIGRKLNEKFGNRLRFLVSGGAQLAPEVFVFFQLCGITLCEGYGLTETTAATCLNLPWAMRRGSVGRPLPGMELRLS
ncbi:MAG TPA: AMP-binding protein, partial [Myxococcota bacterium]|nr:AMP-binding protein [Myxococcota bacterium]